MAKIDNGLYDQYGKLWWEDNGCGAMASIRFLVNPPRFAFFSRVAQELLGDGLRKSSFLDVGCGGGFLAEEFCRLGIRRVTGIDVSYSSVLTATTHAAHVSSDGAVPVYIQARAEELPFGQDSFDIVACCDMLEHVPDMARVIVEISRILKPGGIFFYETINRTALSWFMTIKAMQEWKSTAFVPPRVHVWGMFIKPKELIRIMADNGLNHKEIVGLTPGRNMIANYLNLRRLARGKISYRELARRLNFHLSKDVSNVYIGYAIKGAHVAPSTSEARRASPSRRLSPAKS